MYYLRDRTGKSARIAEKIRKKIGIILDVKPETVTEENLATITSDNEVKKEQAPKTEAKKEETPKTEVKKEEAPKIEAKSETEDKLGSLPEKK